MYLKFGDTESNQHNFFENEIHGFIVLGGKTQKPNVWTCYIFKTQEFRRNLEEQQAYGEKGLLTFRNSVLQLQSSEYAFKIQSFLVCLLPIFSYSSSGDLSPSALSSYFLQSEDLLSFLSVLFQCILVTPEIL